MWSTTFIEMASRAALILLVASISAFDGFKVPPDDYVPKSHCWPCGAVQFQQLF